MRQLHKQIFYSVAALKMVSLPLGQTRLGENKRGLANRSLMTDELYHPVHFCLCNGLDMSMRLLTDVFRLVVKAHGLFVASLIGFISFWACQ